MIIGYYQQIFFGGGTYYKLSKKDDKGEYKIEYSHSVVPNYIPEAELYIKKYDTLEIEDEREKVYFEGRIKEKYIENNSKIEFLMKYITKCDWNKIVKKEYSDNDVDDGICWDFYIEFNNQKYEINGYEKFPKEVTKIVNILKSISEEYLEEIVPNKKDVETKLDKFL